MGISKEAITVTTSATLIVGANNARRGVVVSNEGTATIFIGFDATVDVNNGISLYQSEKMTLSGDDEAFKGNIYGIVSAATQEARYWEYTQ